jgi:hypothetical protein
MSLDRIGSGGRFASLCFDPRAAFERAVDRAARGDLQQLLPLAVVDIALDRDPTSK